MAKKSAVVSRRYGRSEAAELEGVGLPEGEKTATPPRLGENMNTERKFEHYTDKEVNEFFILCGGTEKKERDCIKCKNLSCFVRSMILRSKNRSLKDY